MRHFSADYIFPISSEPIKNGIITVDDDGTILSVSEKPEVQHPTPDIPVRPSHPGGQHLKGIICPGFINTHCHLELSHLRTHISENTGMMGFIKELISKRKNFSNEEVLLAIEKAEDEMLRNGIVAVGDISNGNSTFGQKSKGKLRYHTFIEVFDLNSDNPEEVFANALKLKRELITHHSSLNSSIVPHAPYSVTSTLFQLISEEAAKNNDILSIHNQESEGESELFVSGSGPLFEAYSKMGMNMNKIETTGQNSLRSTLSKLSGAEKLLLVHNTFTSQEDIRWAKTQHSALNTHNLFWCTCPNANIFIENKLPNYNYFIEENAKITVGTDSLASNWGLSVLDELKTIHKHYPTIPLETLLTWATKNGAEFLGFTELGTIEKGKKPGLNLITNVNGMQLTENSEVQKLC